MALGMDERKALKLMEEIGTNAFEYYIYGGAYTEPLHKYNTQKHLFQFLPLILKLFFRPFLMPYQVCFPDNNNNGSHMLFLYLTANVFPFVLAKQNLY
jgi:hypothetical protein